MSAKPENERERIARIIREAWPTAGQTGHLRTKDIAPEVAEGLADAIIAQRESGGDAPVAWSGLDERDLFHLHAEAKKEVEGEASAKASVFKGALRRLLADHSRLCAGLRAAPPAPQALAEPVKDDDIPALLRAAIGRLERYDAPSRPAMLDLASRLRGVLEIPHEAEGAVRQCKSLDENGYIAEKSAIIGALRASAINAPAEAHARVDKGGDDA